MTLSLLERCTSSSCTRPLPQQAAPPPAADPGPLYRCRCAADEATAAYERCLEAIAEGNLVAAEAESRATEQAATKATLHRLDVVRDGGDVDAASALRDRARQDARDAETAVAETRSAVRERTVARKARVAEAVRRARRASIASWRPSR